MASCALRPQFRDTNQVESRATEHEQPRHLRQTAAVSPSIKGPDLLPPHPNALCSTQPALAEADRVPRDAGSFALSIARVLPTGHVRGHTATRATVLTKIARIIGFVSSRRDPTPSSPTQTRATLTEPHRALPDHRPAWCTRRQRSTHSGSPHKVCPQIAQLGFAGPCTTSYIEPRFGISARSVRLVAARLAVENFLRPWDRRPPLYDESFSVPPEPRSACHPP